MTSRVTITLNGRAQSPEEWADELGLRVQTIYNRRYKGLSDEECLAPVRMPGRGVRRPDSAYRWRTQWLRDKALADAQDTARARGKTAPKDVWDLPMSRDPWALGAIDAAEGDGRFTLNEIGHLMGLSRERVRHFETSAIRKIRAACGRDCTDAEIVAMLREVEIERAARDEDVED